MKKRERKEAQAKADREHLNVAKLKFLVEEINKALANSKVQSTFKAIIALHEYVKSKLASATIELKY